MKKIIITLIAVMTFFASCQMNEKVNYTENLNTENTGYSDAMIDIGDYYQVGGDILLDKNDAHQAQMIQELLNGVARGAKSYSVKLWPNKTIAYTYSATFTTAERAIIYDAIKTLEAVSGIKFSYRSKDADYVYDIGKTTNPDIGGRSTLGYTKNAFVEFNGISMAVTLHEFMHGLGISHEHQRTDRDSYVTIKWDNINPAYKSNFNKISLGKNYGSYDYNSVMHYRSKAFAIDTSKVTIDSKGNAIGQRRYLSATDRYTLRSMYGNPGSNNTTSTSWGTPTTWHGWFSIKNEIPNVGDFNGDGKDDVITFIKPSGKVYVALSTGSKFNTSSVWKTGFATASAYVPLVGDFNKDGKDDIVYFTRGTTADVYVALSNGSSFGTTKRWHSSFCYGSEIPLIGDFTGDGRDDIATFTRGSSGDVYVARSTGSAFSGSGASARWHTSFCYRTELPLVADLNGDGRDDILTFTRGTSANVYAALSRGSSFEGTALLYHQNFASGNAIPVAGHFGDYYSAYKREDIIAFHRGTSGDVYGTRSTGQALYSNSKYHDYFCINGEIPMSGDFNGDGKSDLITFLRSTQTNSRQGDVIVSLRK